jgi:hypothetical protein
MAGKSRVKFRYNAVKLSLKNATDETLAKVAMQINAQTKVNIQLNGQIDTGFMLNSVYSITPGNNTFGSAWQTGEYLSRKSGEQEPRTLVRQASLPAGAKAATCVGAEYAIYQEEKHPFLFRAGQQVARQVKGATIKKIFLENLHD